MFVWKAATFLNALKQFKPESFEGLMKIQAAWGTDRQQQVLNEVYPTLPKTSVDYAVMEPASKDKKGKFTICTVQMDVQWLDVGSWPSYGQTLDADSAGNRTAGPGEGLVVKSKGCTVLDGYMGLAFARSSHLQWSDGVKWHTDPTGDLGRIDEEGYFFITDRLKRMINAAGYKVWPAEVEALLFAWKESATNTTAVTVAVCPLVGSVTSAGRVEVRYGSASSSDKGMNVWLGDRKPNW